jgi:putative addiction module CopG family antidote
MAELVKQKVMSGDYASESEVTREGLRSLRERDQLIERWLRNEVLPTLEAHEADPSGATPIDDIFDGMESRHQARKRGHE